MYILVVYEAFFFLLVHINMIKVEGFEVMCEVSSIMEVSQIVNYAQS